MWIPFDPDIFFKKKNDRDNQNGKNNADIKNKEEVIACTMSITEITSYYYYRFRCIFI